MLADSVSTFVAILQIFGSKAKFQKVTGGLKTNMDFVLNFYLSFMRKKKINIDPRYLRPRVPLICRHPWCARQKRILKPVLEFRMISCRLWSNSDRGLKFKKNRGRISTLWIRGVRSTKCRNAHLTIKFHS